MGTMIVYCKINRISWFVLASFYSLFAIGLLSFPGCWRPEGWGIGGHYNDARMEFGRRGANMAKAIKKLEYVVRRDPFYKDSLNLLGRAYYNKGWYKDARQMLKRALAVNPNDEIAWIALGLTQFRMGDDEGGLKSFKGGVTLLSKVSMDGYKDHPVWDRNGHVKNAIRKSVYLSRKGLEVKAKIVRIGEILLYRIDDELEMETSEEQQPLQDQ
jgi:tetratricopeptide (TPR) repeat protein